MVALYGRCLIAAGFYDVGVYGALGEEFYVGQSLGFIFKYPHEFRADYLALLFRVSNACKGL